MLKSEKPYFKPFLLNLPSFYSIFPFRFNEGVPGKRHRKRDGGMQK